MKQPANTRRSILLLPGLAALGCLAGCTAPLQSRTDIETLKSTQPYTEPTETTRKLRTTWPPGQPRLAVELIQEKLTRHFERVSAQRLEVKKQRGGGFHPGVLLLPLYPAKLALGLTGAGGLAAIGTTTYLARWGACNTVATAIAITGGTAYLVKIPLGVAAMATFVALNPGIKWPVAFTYFVVAHPVFILGVVDGIYSPYAAWDRPILETLMLPLNFDIAVLGNLLYRDENGQPAERYTPYSSRLSFWQYFERLGTAWEKGITDAWEFTTDPEPLFATFGKAAAAVWHDGWDLNGHMRAFGLARISPDKKSAFEECLAFAVDPSPFLPSGRAAGQWRTVSKKSLGDPVVTEVLKDAKRSERALPIQEVQATITAAGRDAETLTFSHKTPDKGDLSVAIPLQKALAALCLDDTLRVSFRVRGLPGSGEPHSGNAELPVGELRKAPVGPHVRWLAPSPVIGFPSGAAEPGKNQVASKVLTVRVAVRADTANGGITFWQIRRGGRLVAAGGRPGGPSLGREVPIQPPRPIQLDDPGTDTTVEVEAHDTAGRSTRLSAIFAHTPK